MCALWAPYRERRRRAAFEPEAPVHHPRRAYLTRPSTTARLEIFAAFGGGVPRNPADVAGRVDERARHRNHGRSRPAHAAGGVRGRRSRPFKTSAVDGDVSSCGVTEMAAPPI